MREGMGEREGREGKGREREEGKGREREGKEEKREGEGACSYYSIITQCVSSGVAFSTISFYMGAT